jgi:3',5'-cyclic AMP phosphodiesterase CpdA
MKKLVLLLIIVVLSACTEQKEQSYFFVHLSDPQLGIIDNSLEIKLVTNTVSAINRLNPAFVVITGDLIHPTGNVEKMEELKRMLALIKETIPVYYVPGNHDVGLTASDELLALFRSNFYYDRFSVVHNNTRLIGIDSPLICAKRDTLENEQYQWLENELKKSADNNHRFVFAHHPLFIQGIDEDDADLSIPVKQRGKYIDLFGKYDVQYMFVGHLHRNHTASEGNLTIIVTNSVCSSRSSELPGLRIVKVYPDKVVHDFYSLETLPAKIDL